jgi:hypothetical protein
MAPEIVADATSYEPLAIFTREANPNSLMATGDVPPRPFETVSAIKIARSKSLDDCEKWTKSSCLGAILGI